MCGIGVVVGGAPVEWVAAECPGSPAHGFSPRFARHASVELRRAVPEAALASRGPDGVRRLSLSAMPRGAGSPAVAIELTASVLGIRGAAPVLQPLVSPATGDVLAWNGEVFGGLDEAAGGAGARTPDGGADTLALLRALERASSPGECLARVRGPARAV
ncbi:hypothetical protein KFE25_013085 [Diacronema lutheri]|uniref:Glutamine amidotransferase type-2 domain-containing protein n=1 Tax=Diacronema lutheri TaxID=2081491 RepID=A0A8J5XKI2_DIALT|nr:hypothetical protein KFE25_013085 [Diacronema lutheri]